MGRFETELLASDDNFAALTDLSGVWIDRVHDRRPPKMIILDMESSVLILTNLSRSAERVTWFYNQRGKAEQYIKEGKNAIKWTRLSCRKFRDNAVRLQLHALAYNLANFMRMLALPKEIEHWSLTTLREKLVKIGANVRRHAKYVTFQLAEVAVTRKLFAAILDRIEQLALRPLDILSRILA